MEKKTKYWLLVIFISVVIIRLTLAFSVPNFTYDSYFHLRQVEHITETGLPLYNDELSYGGREMIFLPLFHYVMAFFNLFLPLSLIAKIIPNLFIASLTLIIYLISKKITKNDPASLLSAFIAGFLPILYSTNSFTNETLFLPLAFLTIYFFMNIDQKKDLYLYIFTFLLLSLTSSTTFLIIIGFGIYFLLLKIENKNINKAKLELIIFSFFFYLWMGFLFYKDVLIKEGISFIWQNVPSQIIQQYFPQVSIVEAVVLVSVVPFLAGIFVVYRSLFQLGKGKAFILISLAISTAILAWLRLIRFKLSLSFFGLILAILFASFYEEILNYLKNTKFIRFKRHLLVFMIIILITSTLIPATLTALKQETPSNEEIEAFRWLNENSPQKAGVIALLEEGHLITYYSQRKNLMDDQFSKIKDVNKRFANLNSLFTTKFQTHAISILDNYGYQYLVFTPSANKKYETVKFGYTKGECFRKIYQNETRIYLNKCILSEENER